MDNLSIYSALSIVPDNAKRTINGGRLNGKTDINPMWRIKALTEQFGPCGIGWAYEVTKQWLEPGADGEVSAFCNILLYVKIDGEWSKGIPGTGGSAFVAKERNGLYTSDECYKMALTDALSVSCKALGVAASVYWDKDTTKYDKRPDAPAGPKEPAHTPQYIDEIKQTVILKELNRVGLSAAEMFKFFKEKTPHNAPDSLGHITEKQFKWIMDTLGKRPDKT